MIIPGLIRGVELIEARDNVFLYPPVQLGVYLRLFCCLNATLLPYNNTITPYMHDWMLAIIVCVTAPARPPRGVDTSDRPGKGVGLAGTAFLG